VKASLTADRWSEIRSLFNEAFRSSFHFSVASVGPEGEPHVTPIGSVLLGAQGKAIYFELFTTQLPKNVKADPRVCLLAVNSGRPFWLRALLRGRFPTPPAVRLYGRVVGDRRPATEEELSRWRRRLGILRWTKGYDILWRKLDFVREVEIEAFEWVNLGKMTARG
jgi:hypothetical protein